VRQSKARSSEETRAGVKRESSGSQARVVLNVSLVCSCASCTLWAKKGVAELRGDVEKARGRGESKTMWRKQDDVEKARGSKQVPTTRLLICSTALFLVVAPASQPSAWKCRRHFHELPNHTFHGFRETIPFCRRVGLCWRMPVLPFFPSLSTCFLLFFLSTGLFSLLPELRRPLLRLGNVTGIDVQLFRWMPCRTSRTRPSRDAPFCSFFDGYSLAVCLKGKETDNRVRITRWFRNGNGPRIHWPHASTLLCRTQVARDL